MDFKLPKVLSLDLYPTRSTLLLGASKFTPGKKRMAKGERRWLTVGGVGAERPQEAKIGDLLIGECELVANILGVLVPVSFSLGAEAKKEDGGQTGAADAKKNPPSNGEDKLENIYEKTLLDAQLAFIKDHQEATVILHQLLTAHPSHIPFLHFAVISLTPYYLHAVMRSLFPYLAVVDTKQPADLKSLCVAVLLTS